MNTDKTKVMKISPHSRSPPPQQQLKYQGCTLEWVNRFTYLGVYVEDRGHMQTEQAPILKKATRAQFKLIRLGKSLSFDTKIWLHQTMVDPILLHGCEIWSVDGRHETLTRHGIYTTYADTWKKPLPMESIKRRYIRMQMGLPRSAPLLAIRGDSGVPPLYMEAIARTTQYLQILRKVPAASLLGVALATQDQMAGKDQQCWLLTVKQLINQMHMEQDVLPDKYEVIDYLKQDYAQNWYCQLWKPKENGRMGTRLRWYHKYKTNIGKEAYLNGPLTGIQKAMARMRLGCHGLPVEVGRWEKKRYKDRICHRCTIGEIGNELHIFRCPANLHMQPKGFPKVNTIKKLIRTMRKANHQTCTFIRDVIKAHR